MNILAIDLGESTGYCLLKETRTHHGDRSNLQTSYTGWAARWGTLALDRLHTLYEIEDSIDLIVIEAPVPTPRTQVWGMSVILEQLRTHLGELRDRKVIVIRPTEWKQRFKNYPLPRRGMLRTSHERDAWRIASWAAYKYGGQPS